MIISFTACAIKTIPIIEVIMFIRVFRVRWIFKMTGVIRVIRIVIQVVTDTRFMRVNTVIKITWAAIFF